MSLRLLIVAASLGACVPPQSAAPAPASAPGGKPIVIGAYLSLSGDADAASFGESTQRGIELAIAQANSQGGVRGRPVLLVVEDDSAPGEDEGTAITRLVSRPDVVAIEGEVLSRLTLVGGKIAEQAGVPMLSPGSTLPSITEIGPHVFRACLADPAQGVAAAHYAHAIGAAHVGILVDRTQTYSKTIAQAFDSAFARNGGPPTRLESYAGGDFTAALATFAAEPFDLVFMPGFSLDVAAFAKQARAQGLTFRLLGADGWDSATLGEEAGDAIEGGVYVNHFASDDPDPAVQAFVVAYRARYGAVPDGLAALGYDAARLLIDAIGRAPEATREAVTQALAATRDFPSLAGPLSMDEHRNATRMAVVQEIRGGKPVFVRRVSTGL